MTIPPRPATQEITTTVPTHLAPAFLQAVDEFFTQAREQRTPGQRAAEIRAQDRDAGLDSLAHRLAVAERDSGQSSVVARFLAGLYNGRAYPFDLTALRALDADLFEHCLAVLRLDNHSSVPVHRYVPDGEARWQRMIAAWGLSTTPPAAPVELTLSAEDSEDLACDLLDIHRFVWRDAGRGPLDRRPGEHRPDTLGSA
ncbi:hypothetical protein Q3O97_05575 [Ralstonia pseudosolanacearum]|uniref:DUF7673 family protein n=1 Tax=Ralstonia pseudosolanacearum TaxID=1310165 RepID=UPI0026FD6A17|nr:hypothetical protein [Ralstonia pseudosolanacearum]MDO3615307.1 hypothetical protein [Ralstonia pseudosolanacearum]